MQKFIQKYRNELIYRYFFSYLLIFLLPFLLLTSALYFSSVVGLEKQLETTNRNSLKQVNTMLNDRFKELEKLVDHVQINPRLTSFMVNHPYYSIEGRSELNRIQSGTSFISDMFLHFRKSPTLYSHNGAYSVEALINHKYGRYDINGGQFNENLEVSVPTLAVNERTNNNQGSALLQYFIPMTSGGAAYGTAVFFINESELQGIINNASANYAGDAYIIN